MNTYPESDIQFLARMVIATREGGQIPSGDAQRLSNLGQFGDSHARGGPTVTTMPEERREGSRLPDQSGAKDVVRG